MRYRVSGIVNTQLIERVLLFAGLEISSLTTRRRDVTSRSPMRTATRRASREPLSRLACGDSRPRQSDAIRLAEARFFASASVDVRDFVRLEQCGLSVQSRVAVGLTRLVDL